MSGERGFTLLEMMLVIVLLSVVMSLVIGRSSFNEDRSVDRLFSALEFAAGQATNEQRPYGLQFQNRSWQILRLTRHQHQLVWLPITRRLAKGTLADDVQIQLQPPAAVGNGYPSIVFWPDEITPFSLWLQQGDRHQVIQPVKGRLQREER